MSGFGLPPIAVKIKNINFTKRWENEPHKSNMHKIAKSVLKYFCCFNCANILLASLLAAFCCALSIFCHALARRNYATEVNVDDETMEWLLNTCPEV